MSLIKKDSKNNIKQSWLDKKSEKRLRSVLKKLRINQNKLRNIYFDLRSYGLEYKYVLKKYNFYVLSSAQLDNYITRKY
jgi:hypothetical protein